MMCEVLHVVSSCNFETAVERRVQDTLGRWFFTVIVLSLGDLQSSLMVG